MKEIKNIPLYVVMSRKLLAIDSCVRANNHEWLDRHTEALENLDYHLPSGGGFDNGSSLDLDRSKPERIVINTAYHHMPEWGMYDGWSHHSVIITPSLAFGAEIRITGKNRNDIKDYMHECFDMAINELVPPTTGYDELVAANETAISILSDLVEWESYMGGFETPAWERARHWLEEART